MDFSIKSVRKSDVVSPNVIDPRFLMNFRGSFDINPEFQLDFWLRYSDAVSGVDPEQVVPSYLALDARLAWKPHENLELAFIANNITDPQHPEFYDGNSPNPLQAERMFWLQGNWKF